MSRILIIVASTFLTISSYAMETDRPRARDIGLEAGTTQTGTNNAITNVATIFCGTLEAIYIGTVNAILEKYNATDFDSKLSPGNFEQ